MLFNVKGNATIEHINIRRGGDDSPVSVDLKVSMERIGLDAAAAALGVESVADVEQAFFIPANEDDECPAKFLGLQSIACFVQWKGHHELRMSRQPAIRVGAVKKIVLRPRQAGMFDATFSIAIDDPPRGFVELLAELLHDGVEIDLQQDDELPLGNAA